ncbi:hypothetical protein ElyMa_002542700, partial [Elysia marginata]
MQKPRLDGSSENTTPFGAKLRAPQHTRQAAKQKKLFRDRPGIFAAIQTMVQESDTLEARRGQKNSGAGTQPNDLHTDSNQSQGLASVLGGRLSKHAMSPSEGAERLTHAATSSLVDIERSTPPLPVGGESSGRVMPPPPLVGNKRSGRAISPLPPVGNN